MKKNIAIIGCQNGDEGKGKVITFVAPILINLADGQEILSYRFQGGGNAGHTAIIGEKRYALHQLPSGIILAQTYGLLGKGMFIEPKGLVKEIETISSSGIVIDKNKLGISSKAHITLDYHLNDDQSSFNLAEHTSTGNGIKQTARDKVNRTGIRFVEFLDRDLMIKILKEKTFPQGLPERYNSYEQFADSYAEERNFLAPFLALEHEIFNKFDYALAEGAQGLMLDLDDGQYPGITSSNPAHPTHRPDLYLGVFKMYLSSVGIGDRPFVTEMDADLQSRLIQPWGEFGTTTKKPRHIGWFNAVEGKYALESAHLDALAGTKLDDLELLAELGEKIKICVAYEIDGKRYDRWETNFDRRDVLSKAKPIYEEFDSWERTVEKDGQTLTPNAQKYVNSLEELLGKRFSLIGVGPEQKQMIVREQII
ncbi:MAG: adenylosuccinate synthetase [Candidatus Woesearchaeota archaeon]